jgi:transposase-like protein
MIVDALKRSGGSISAASRELGITGRMVRYKIKQFEIDYRGLFSRRAQSARAKLHGSEAA